MKKKNEKENDKLNKKLGFKNNVFGATQGYETEELMAFVNPCEIHDYGDFHEDGTCHGSYISEIRANLGEAKDEHPLIRVKRSAVGIGDIYDHMPVKAEHTTSRVHIKKGIAKHLEQLIRYGDETGVPIEDALEFLLAGLKDPQAYQKFYNHPLWNLKNDEK